MMVTSPGIIALIPEQAASEMAGLRHAARVHLIRCSEISTFMQRLSQGGHAVVLVPATLSSEDWFRIWGIVSILDQRPSILIYAWRTDFQTWTGILEAGAFDVVVAPFTQEIFEAAISAAMTDFEGRQKG
jgi:DNA-binding response OmpR family regulator